ncbi:DUF2809 domain-containing protein [Microbacterium sp. No. 7]|uniref:DUF2809 domain-containing protein n=1 Tax=Microbacterium sp. No. 7 TaxID=1714373 RepID=UPI000A55C2C8|nr:DUF2809 domain-containing protein [Microbacterium sp. No. 7]
MAAIVVAVLVGVGLFVHFALPDTHASDVAADALYAAAVYAALVVLVPRWPRMVVAAIAAGWCVAVELFQLTGIPEQWGVVFTPAMLVFGTVFEPRDLVVYIVTIAVAVLADVLVSRRRPPRVEAAR